MKKYNIDEKYYDKIVAEYLLKIRENKKSVLKVHISRPLKKIDDYLFTQSQFNEQKIRFVFLGIEKELEGF